MNRNRYRLVFNTSSGMLIPVAETARRQGKTGGKAACGALVALTGALLGSAVQADMPVPSAGGAIPSFVTAGQASYQVNGAQAYVNQVGNKSILNWQSFNVSPGSNVQFRQVDSLATNNLVQGANFTSLNRIWDNNPSVIAGAISQAAGQKANVILVNSNGIAFMGGSQVNLNSFTASTLNMQDGFLDNFLPNWTTPQFENALDGSPARGFVKVLEGARITAGSQGRVMLIAPTVVNRGTVEAPDGQVIAAAASKVYLRSASTEDTNVRGLLIEVDSPAGLADHDTANPDVRDGQLDGQTVSLANAAEDKLGAVSNFGELSTPRGNVTMVGYAVNQQGIARATTSVVSNGSVYLLAKDTKSTVVLDPDDTPASARAGRVVLGENSLTEVQPDTMDTTTALDGTTGEGLARASQVKVLGQDIRMAGGAVIDAPSGEVSLLAVDTPNDLRVLSEAGQAASNTARIHIADGARINVAGLDGVAVSAARNGVEVELRGDELKDSPVNQQGALRGQKVYVDINRALANADAGESTLIAKDSLEAYQAKLERTAAERSTAGGTVNLLSAGETILENGVQVDLSGGSVQYTAANVKTTLLTTGGKLVDIADADAETYYDGIATRYVVDYGRWNRQEVLDLGQSYHYDPGYVEGKDAGTLNVVGMKAVVLQAGIAGRTTVGELQRESGTAPQGARLNVGRTTENVTTGSRDYKQNQDVVFSATGGDLPAGFGFGDVLSNALQDTLVLNPTLVGNDKVAQLQVFSNQAAEVRDALRVPTGGSIAITATGVTIGADIEARSGSIAIKSDQNLFNGGATGNVSVANGVTLTTRGVWTNERPGAGGGEGLGRVGIDGGTVTLVSTTGDVELGADSLIDVQGGARLRADGKLDSGNGGNVTLDASQAVVLGGAVQGYAPGRGGTFTLNTQKIQIGGAADPGALNLDAAFFEQGGFADFRLTGRSGVDIADGTLLTPAVISRELDAAYLVQPGGSDITAFSTLAKRDDRVRQAVNLSFEATNPGSVIRLGENAKILADDQAAISFAANTRVDLQGEVHTAGGSIAALVKRSSSVAYDPSAAVWLGAHGVLDVAGVARTYTDSRGLVQGTVLAGGTVTLGGSVAADGAVTGGQGFVVTEAGSRIDISGAAPVRLDVQNESGGIGRLVGSDAGTLKVRVQEGALLDGTIAAQGGSAANRGGSFDLTLTAMITDEPRSDGGPNTPRVLNVGAGLAGQSAGLASGDAIPNALNGNTRLDMQRIEAAGFDRVRLASISGTIRLENGLDVGAGRTLPLRELTLDAPRIETAGNVALTADAVQLGNYGEFQNTDALSGAGSGSFRVDARQIELAGKLALDGMTRSELNATEAVVLAGGFAQSQPVTNSPNVDVRPAGALRTQGDLAFTAPVVSPATYVDYAISAPGATVSFSQGGQGATQPWSAFGSVRVEAQDIVQGGTLWAPLGRIALYADNQLTFADGSLTSVAADAGSVLPFGKLVNGRDWVFDLGLDDTDSAPVDDIAEQKSLIARAAKVEMADGARVDLSGGGDAQAYEFTVGPGGSRDILADADTYAILPGYQGGFAPVNAQEAFDRASGEAIYLSGVAGLADGAYTLLPAHYALLPGAYAIKLDTGGTVMPGQAYVRQDGVRIAAGYLTDTRTGAPRDADWQGVQVLTRDQVLARSEFALARASQFFSGSDGRPQDAGLLSIVATGTGADALQLAALYDLAAGANGRGGKVDISAENLAIVGNTPTATDPDAVVLDVDTLNAFGARSLLIGGTRSRDGETTTLAVDADRVMLANDAASPLAADEVILAARDTLTLKSGSRIEAQGTGDGPDVQYSTAGNGALVRAGATSATFARTGNPDRSQGTLAGEAGSTIVAARAAILDATFDNAYQGTLAFSSGGEAVAGELAVGAPRINFGAAPAGSTGLTYGQAELDAFDGLAALVLNSYSSFDLYGDAVVGGVDGAGKPTLQNLTLQGAGLAGLDNASQTATLRATNLALANPAGVGLAPGGALGHGALAIVADTLTLGSGDKTIAGYDHVSIDANVLRGDAQGTTTVDAPLAMTLARLEGGAGADQTLRSAAALSVASRSADRALAPVTTLGAKWVLAGTAVDFDSQASLPSGTLRLEATQGDVHLGTHARVEVAGRSVAFFDTTKPSWGGTAELASTTGNVIVDAGANVDVSAAAGGDAGLLVVTASQGTVALADGSVTGQAPADADGARGEGAQVAIDAGHLADFSQLNTTLNSGGFDGARTLRVRNGNLIVAAGDSVAAHTIALAADNGDIDIAGTLDASGTSGGQIGVYAAGDATVQAGAQLLAAATVAGQDGGAIEIGSRAGSVDLVAGGTVDLSGGTGGQGGSLNLRALRSGNDVAVGALDGTITGARAVSVEAVRVYSGIDTLLATGSGSGSTLTLDDIKADNTAYAADAAAIRTRLGKDGDATFHLLSGVEVRAPGDLTLGQDWNLAAARAGGEAGVLTLIAENNLAINASLSDGFAQATPMKSSSNPAELLSDASWSYRLAAGADAGAADPLAVKAGAGDLNLAAGKLIRTGTGDIRAAAGGNIVLGADTSVIYTAGRLADSLSGFVAPAWSSPSAVPNFAQFSQDGGDVSLVALGDIIGATSKQLINNWLFRQGSLNADGTAYVKQPAWWVRFDQFRQGVGALGGGDVSLKAAGRIENLSASTPSQGRMASGTPDAGALAITGGGTVRIEAGGDVLGGIYYADRGDVILKTAGQVTTAGQLDSDGQPIYTILALGDGTAQVHARGDVDIHAVFNPTLFDQSSSLSSSTAKSVFNVTNNSGRDSVFSTYSDASAAVLQSLDGDVHLHNPTTLSSTLDPFAKPLNDNNNNATRGMYGLDILPPSLSVVAFQGDVTISNPGAAGELVLAPSAQGALELLAADSIRLNQSLVMSDRDPRDTPSAVLPGNPSATINPVVSWGTKSDPLFHAAQPVHAGDAEPVRIYAVAGDISGGSQSTGNQTRLDLPKAFRVEAGRDILNLTIEAQHADAANSRSLVQAGRDIVFATGIQRTEDDHIHVGGPGTLDVVAGRDIDLGTSGGILSRGNTVNPALSATGADIRIAAGVGAGGVDYAAAIARLTASLQAGTPDDTTLWLARWLTGDDTLTAGDALAAVQQVAALDAAAQDQRVRDMLYAALRQTGRDSLDAGSRYAADYARGYAALELVFPGIGDRDADGNFTTYQGDLNLFASRIKTESGGNIEFMLPGGNLIAGLTNTPAALVDVGNNVLGVVAVGPGDIKGFARGDMLVNQSRILTVGGGDVLLWSSEGDIDAGKGKKTAVAVPPPLILVDKFGNVTQILQGAASGSGIGALQPAGGQAGDVDLIAPKGTVNAGDAGIRAGNLNIAAQVVLGADNISVSGTSTGTPVADTSAVTAASSGASNAGGDVSSTTAALAQNLSEAARAAEELKKAFKPTFITAEVIGHGE